MFLDIVPKRRSIQYKTVCIIIYMLWFKFSFGAKFLKLVQFLFSFVVHSLPQCGTMANKIENNSKNFKPRINLNHNICIGLV